MGGRIRRFTAKEIERLLARFGFGLVSQKGNHGKWRNFETGHQVIVPSPNGRTLHLGTNRNILTNAEIHDAEWRD